MTNPATPITDPDAVEVLILDANELSRLGLALLLRRESWVSRCLLAGTLEQAERLAQRHRPAVAAVEVSRSVSFPGPAITTLRRHRPGLQVVLTSHCQATTVREPRQAGAAAFLPAGTPSATLVSAIHSSLREERVVVDAGPAFVPLPSPELPSSLSRRERDVLRLLVTGATNREIAAQLYLGPDTVKKHASSVYRKLGVRNRTEATQQAARLLTGAA